MIWVILFVIVVVAIGIGSGMQNLKQVEADRNTVSGKLKGWDVYISPHGRGIIALDANGKRVALGSAESFLELPWSSIASVEIEKNGQAIQKTNRGSQALGATAGAILLGPLGLLMGGLTGSKREQSFVSELSLKIIVEHGTKPVHRVVFFKMPGKGSKPDSVFVKQAAELMERHHALLSNAMRSGQRDMAAQTSPPLEGINLETRLGKLWELHQAGALSFDEFSSQKTALLDGAQPKLTS